MAERRDKCPKCFAYDPNVLEILNPETTDLNAKANLECYECKYVWEDKITSPYYEKMRDQGFIR